MTGNVGAELSLILPKATAPEFPGLFGVLEREQSALKIESYGL